MKTMILAAMLEILINPGFRGNVNTQKAQPGPGELEPAGFRTNPDLEVLMERADRFADEGRFDLASELWQKVIDECEDSVVTRPEWKQSTFNNSYQRFKPMLAEIESKLAQLPGEGLRAYRLRADGEAKALLAGDGPRIDERLSQVVRRYFLSSEGDDAAMQLATAQLDRYELVSAIWLLQRVLSFYPDSSLPRGQLLLRLAAAHARVGDIAQARKTMAEIRSKHAGDVEDYVLAAMDRDLDRRGDGRIIEPVPEQPVAELHEDLAELWTQRYDVKMPRGLPSMFNLGSASETTKFRAEQLIQQWRDKQWFPSGQVVFDRDRMYFKADKRLICCDAKTGKVLWMGHRNEYPRDDISRGLSQNLRNAKRTTSYSTMIDIQFFADRVYQSFNLIGDTLYNIEGKPSYLQEPAEGQQRRNYYYYGRTMRRTRENWLSAYDVRSGKLRWHIKAPVFDGKETRSGFMTAPVSYASFLLVPVSDGHTLWLTALDRATGELVWKRFLCDEPATYCSPYSPVEVSVDGGEAYIATGAGLVFAVDAVSGSLRWAVSYPRVYKGNVWQQLQRPVTAWLQDTLLPTGRQLIVMASDSDHLISLDRRTGALLWESPQLPTADAHPGKYALGLRGDALFVAGNRVIRRYDVNGGRLVWETEIDTSLGQGLLQGDAAYLPQENGIARINLETGKIERHIKLASAIHEPIGNLFVDGDRLYALGFRRVSRLGSLSAELEELKGRIEQGDIDSIKARMRMHSLNGRMDEAIQDLEAMYHQYLSDSKAYEGSKALFDGIMDLDLIVSKPAKVLDLLERERRQAARIEDASEAEIKELNERRALIEYQASGDQTSQAVPDTRPNNAGAVIEMRGGNNRVIRIGGEGRVIINGEIFEGLKPGNNIQIPVEPQPLPRPRLIERLDLKNLLREVPDVVPDRAPVPKRGVPQRAPRGPIDDILDDVDNDRIQPAPNPFAPGKQP